MIADVKLHYPNVTTSFESVVNKTVAEFEERKRSFDGREDIHIVLNDWCNAMLTIPK